jgi:mono/diheme cytochrome c family protein
MFVCIFLAGCRQKMASQPSYRPLQATSFFPDGRSARPLVAGTIARGHRPPSGKGPIQKSDWLRVSALVGALPDHPVAAAVFTADWSFYIDAFPMEISEKVLQRGRERFNIYCAVCHDRVGTGKGMIVERGFTQPPSYHTDFSRGLKLQGVDIKLPQAPVGYYFEVITRGFGAMPAYADQVSVKDRWAIIAYIRALQLSQHASLADVSSDQEKQRLLKIRDVQP